MKLKTVAFVAQKGGVGKTTDAVNLAVASVLAGVQTIVFDLDPQENAVIWAERRSKYLSSQKNTAISAGPRKQTNQLPYVEFLTERRLPEKLREKDAEGFDLAIIDTPPAAGPQAVAAAQEADLILIPCGTDLIDIDAIRRTALLVKTVTTPAFVVFSAVSPGATVLLEDARALVSNDKKAPLETAPVVLRERSAYRVAWPRGQGVTEIESQGKAAAEITALQRWVFEQLQVCTPKKELMRRKDGTHG
jgi:chromosome partitioning protein